jgi:hypothetical protein
MEQTDPERAARQRPEQEVDVRERWARQRRYRWAAQPVELALVRRMKGELPGQASQLARLSMAGR